MCFKMLVRFIGQHSDSITILQRLFAVNPSKAYTGDMRKKSKILLVPGTGLEPVSLAAADFKSAVYTIPPPGQNRRGEEVTSRGIGNTRKLADLIEPRLQKTVGECGQKRCPHQREPKM